MKVIAMSKTLLSVAQFDNVSNIAYSDGSVTITYNTSSTATYALADYVIQIMNA